jgi:hypothetical protein
MRKAEVVSVHAMKLTGKSRGTAPSFLTFGLDTGKWSTALPRRKGALVPIK